MPLTGAYCVTAAFGWNPWAVAALVISLGTTNAFVAATSRLGYPLGRDGAFPAALGRLDRAGVPRAAILVGMAAGVRLLDGAARILALVGCVACLAVVPFIGASALVPVVLAGAAAAYWRLRPRSGATSSP